MLANTHRRNRACSLFVAIISPLLLTQLLSTPLCAQSVLQSDFTVALTKGSPLGLGGAYRALANDNNAILLNPAGIMRANSYTFGFDYLTSDFDDADLLSGSVIDSNPEERFAIGFSYDQISQEIVGVGVDLKQYTLALATPITPSLSIGASGKYYQSSIDSPLVGGPDGFTMDVGALYFIIPQLSAAVTLQNIIDGNDNPNIPLLLAGGLALRPDDKSLITLDVVEDFSTPNEDSTNLHFGAQYSFSSDFSLRSGFGWDRVRDDSFFGTGLLVTAPRGWLSFTYTRRFDSEADTFATMLELKI